MLFRSHCWPVQMRQEWSYHLLFIPIVVKTGTLPKGELIIIHSIQTLWNVVKWMSPGHEGSPEFIYECCKINVCKYVAVPLGQHAWLHGALGLYWHASWCPWPVLTPQRYRYHKLAWISTLPVCRAMEIYKWVLGNWWTFEGSATCINDASKEAMPWLLLLFCFLRVFSVIL